MKWIFIRDAVTVHRTVFCTVISPKYAQGKRLSTVQFERSEVRSVITITAYPPKKKIPHEKDFLYDIVAYVVPYFI
jgi:hypothetical protein